MSTLFTELFQGNEALTTEKKIKLVQGLEEYLAFDKLFTQTEIAPSEISSLLKKYGWFWVSCGLEHFVVNDITDSADKKTTQISYYDTRKGIISQMNFTDFVEQVRKTNSIEELEYAVLRLQNTSSEGGVPKSPINNPLETYINQLVNGQNRVNLWRQNWAQLAKSEFDFWAVDFWNPELARNTEISIFTALDPADPFVQRFSELIAVADLQQKREIAYDYLEISVKKRYANLIKNASDPIVEKQYKDELKTKQEDAQLALSQANTALIARLKLNVWNQKQDEEILQVNNRFKTEVADFFTELEKSPTMLRSNLQYAKRILDYTKFNGKSALDAWVYICNADAWSAAFITYIVKNGMLHTEETCKSNNIANFETDKLHHFGFNFSARHADYWSQALANRLNRDYSKPFWLFHLYEKQVQIGDIIVKAREYEKIELDLSLKSYCTFNKTTLWRIARKGKASHADIIYKIANEPDPVDPTKTNKYAYTIGGNTRDLTNEVNTVGRKKYLLAPAPMPNTEISKDNPAEGSVLYEVGINGVGPTESSSAWSIIKVIDIEISSEWNSLSALELDTYKEVFGKKAPNAAAQKMKIIPPLPVAPLIPVP